MTLLEKKIKESGYKQSHISKEIGISERTLYNWTHYLNIDKIEQFYNLLELINADQKEIFTDIKNRRN